MNESREAEPFDPAATVIPVLVYPDVRAAVDWISAAFGFQERLRIGEGHRSQLAYGDGAVILAEASHGRQAPAEEGDPTHSVTVRTDDVRAHAKQARAAGAVITADVVDLPFGERQYTARDPWGHYWTFSESIADVDPASWGGTLVTST